MSPTKWNATKVRAMNVEELQIFLEAEGFSSSVTDKLKDEEIDGMCFLLLTDAILSSLQFKTGTKIKLRTMIEKMKTELVGSTVNLIQDDESCTGDSPLLRDNQTVAKAEIATGEASYPLDFLGSSSTETSSPATLPNVDAGDEVVNYNVLEMLENDPEGKKVIENYRRRKDPIIMNDERITIVQVAVNSLTEQIQSLYPTSSQKHALAEAIVEAFPCLKSDLPGVSPHYAFYNNKTNSFIETRIKTMRLRHSQKRKAAVSPKTLKLENKKRKRESLKNGFETEKQQVICMKKLVSNATHKPIIAEYMENTFDYRRLQIDSRILQTATDVLEEYPRLVDYDCGSLIVAEYYLMNKEASDFENFENDYKERLIALATCEKMGVGKENLHETPDRCLSALIYCVKLQPSVVRRKSMTSMAEILEQLIVFQDENWKIRELETNRTSYSSQPFILCLGTMTSPSRYYNVVIENTIIPCGTSVEQAFKVLYSSFYCFGLQYPKRLHSFYRFFDDCVFKLTSKNKGTILASCLAFEARVKAVRLPSVDEIEPDDAQ